MPEICRRKVVPHDDLVRWPTSGGVGRAGGSVREEADRAWRTHCGTRVRETNQVLSMIDRVCENGLSVILISHDMPNVFEVAYWIELQRLGRSAGVVTPRSPTRNEVVAIMTGATRWRSPPGKVPD